MLALMGWTLVVTLMMGRRRIGAVQDKRVHAREFALGETAAVPADVSIVNRHYMNLLELPVQFYVGTLVYFMTQRADAIALALAWTYVGMRFVHSWVHLTTNRVFH